MDEKQFNADSIQYVVEEFKSNYDWKEAFGFSGEDINDIVEIVAEDAGYNDGDPWICIVKMVDGRYITVDAWCDYTGWDCQSGGTSEEYPSLAMAISDLTPEQARRLGYIHESTK